MIVEMKQKKRNNMIRLDDKLEGVTSVGISGHVRPDGDCVGSTLAVYNYITVIIDSFKAV